MEGERFIELYLENRVALFYFVALLFLLSAAEARLYVHLTIERVNVSASTQEFIDALLSARVLAGILFIVYMLLLVGSLIRAIVRFVEPEEPLSIRSSLNIAAIAAIAYFLLRFFGPDAVFLVYPLTVDLAGVGSYEDFIEAIGSAYDSRQAAHPLAAKLVIGFIYAGFLAYLALVRYLTYKLRGVRVATYVTLMIFAFMLVGVFL